MGFFLDPERADESGLVAVGGDLSPRRLLDAYRHGIFPWYEEGYPVCWWSPDPRAIFELHQFHVPKRLQRTIHSGKFQVTFNQAFTDVMIACGDRLEGTWITNAMLAGYARLHELGYTHSVETWRHGNLVGGVYGVAIGGLFAGESMFYRESDASKVALAFLVQRLRERGFTLFDIQMRTEHTMRLGAIEIPRAEYLRRLKKAVSLDVTFADR